LGDECDDLEFGGGEAGPAAGGAFAFASGPGDVGDRFIDGERFPFGPGGVEGGLAEGVSGAGQRAKPISARRAEAAPNRRAASEKLSWLVASAASGAVVKERATSRHLGARCRPGDSVRGCGAGWSSTS
jgi:hypothetical protein